MITIKEKAKQMLKYYKFKDIALFEIDILLNVLLNSKFEYKKTINHWNKVKKEIEKL